MVSDVLEWIVSIVPLMPFPIVVLGALFAETFALAALLFRIAPISASAKRALLTATCVLFVVLAFGPALWLTWNPMGNEGYIGFTYGLTLYGPWLLLIAASIGVIAGLSAWLVGRVTRRRRTGSTTRLPLRVGLFVGMLALTILLSFGLWLAVGLYQTG